MFIKCGLYYKLITVVVVQNLLFSVPPDIRVSRPILIPGFPENATVLVGGHVKLVCKLHQPASTRLQWFKKDSNRPGPDGSPILTALTVRKWFKDPLLCIFSVFRKGGVMLHLFPLQPLLENLSKVNILPLLNVTVEDAGVYVCKAENSVGQIARSAWVKVLSGKPYHHLTFSSSGQIFHHSLTGQPGQPLALYCHENGFMSI